MKKAFEDLVGIVVSDRDVVNYRAWAMTPPEVEVGAIQEIRMWMGEPIVVYCPAGNKDWESLYRPMFKILGGVVPTELLNGIGMGFSWPRNILSKKYADLSQPSV